ncbi:DUF3500 domain-containing protein [Methylobacterium sp. E-066]|uniref:DUF3500 domain-containing protein n=1 Tax=Methylobacterium sp. E-066 TaxID=2836584 RepID=UPI001FB9CCC9|nr:DUF3500 domain-containing protein [Methylobacterium sp. E-066]MCJ2141117.1 DUF3500 domain-containing protein [Methylobacterium sp. E-066]
MANPAHGAGAAQTQAIAAAATAFLSTLSDEQRAAVQFAFEPQPKATAAHFRGGMRSDVDMVGEQYGRAMWSNFPVSDVPRPGLRLGSLDDAQREAAMALLRVLLSDRGYRKVLDIMGSDQALADTGTPYASGRAAYTLAIFGTPSVTDFWMVQFGGHHLALNVTMLGGHAVLAPVLTGCLPAIYEEDGKRVRALAAENDKAFALLDTFDSKQRGWAVIGHPVSELVLGPGRDGVTMLPVGVKGSTLAPRQREMLFDLIHEWAGLLNDVHAAPRLSEIRDGLDETFFAWSGPTTRKPDRNGASYFRIQGPRLFIEFSPQEPGGDLTMHVHTIYRDPGNAYGRALTT